jgi:hypothetical protein
MPGFGPIHAGAIALAVAGCLLILGGNPLVGSASGAARPAVAFIPASTGPTWSNGLYELTVGTAGPAFSIRSAADSRIGMNQSLFSLVEINATGNLVAFAHLLDHGTVWNTSASSSPTGTLVTTTSRVTVQPATGSWEDDGNGSGNGSRDEISPVLGQASVAVSFYVNSSAGSSPWTLTYSINVTGWPWNGTSDSLGIQVNSSALQPGAVWASGKGNSIAEVTQQSNATIATYLWSGGARVHYSDGSEAQTAVGSYRNFSRTTSTSFVRLAFESVSGGYSSLSYDPWITLNPTVFHQLAAWVLTPASLEVTAVATGVAVLLAAVAAVRRRPPTEDSL